VQGGVENALEYMGGGVEGICRGEIRGRVGVILGECCFEGAGRYQGGWVGSCVQEILGQRSKWVPKGRWGPAEALERYVEADVKSVRTSRMIKPYRSLRIGARLSSNDAVF
jgi:hypothetical protein